MKNIFNFKLNDKYSVTTKNVDLMNIYTPLNNQQRNTGIIFHKTEDEIKELKVSKIYKTNDLEYRISSIPMDCKTDQSILYALLSQNKQEFSISIKELAIKIGVNKRQATSRATKERIMNSINKHRCFDFTLLKEGIFHTGFSILSYQFDMPEKDHLTIYFDKQFLNLYQQSNNSIINLEKYLELKSEYSKLIYSMVNNFFNKDKTNEVTIFPDVFRKRLNNVDENGKTTKITAQQRQKINTALKELKTFEILKTYRLNKNDSLVFRINQNITKTIKIEEIEMSTPKSVIKNNIQLIKDSFKDGKLKEVDITKNIDTSEKRVVLSMIEDLKTELKTTKSPLQYHCIEENIKKLNEILNPKKEEPIILEKVKEEVIEMSEEDSFFNSTEDNSTDFDLSFEELYNTNIEKEFTIIKK